MKLSVQNARLAFPNIFKPATVNGEGEPAYSAALLLTNGAKISRFDEAKKKYVPVTIEDACDLVGQEKWGVKWPTVKKEIAAKDRFAYHDGDTKSQYDGFAGLIFITTRSQASVRPTVIDRDKTPLTAEDGRPYAGCYVNANIDLWPQDNSYGKRINAQLRGVQFSHDGDSFGGGTAASADEFEDVTDGAGADDLT